MFYDDYDEDIVEDKLAKERAKRYPNSEYIKELEDWLRDRHERDRRMWEEW